MRKNSIVSVILISLALLSSCAKDSVVENNGVVSPSPEDNKPVYMSINASIKDMESRAIRTAFVAGDEMGIFMNDTCKNRKYTYTNSAWNGMPLRIGYNSSKVVAYLPYSDNVTDYKSLPIDISKQEDYLYGTNNVSALQPTLSLQMKHALSLCRITILKGEYAGIGHVESITINGIETKGTLNAETGALTTTGETGEIQIGGSYTLDDSKPVTSELIQFPVESADGMRFDMVIDGQHHSYYLSTSNKHEAGYINSYTLSLKSGYNCEINLDEVHYDVEKWSTYGKTDNIILSTMTRSNKIYIERNIARYGIEARRNEGKFLDMAIMVTTEFKGKYRFVLMDQNENIVEQYPPVDLSITPERGIAAQNMLAYITAPVGDYYFIPLFQKEGESTWMRSTYSMSVNDDGTESKDLSNWKIKVIEDDNTPTCRVVQRLSDEYGGWCSYAIYHAPDNDNFYVSYILSNKSKTALKGTIRAVWERAFDDDGACYRKSAQPKYLGYIETTGNEVEWHDIIGTQEINISSGIRYWQGAIACKFIKQRKPCIYNVGDGSTVQMCPPLVHLYWKAEGSSEWKLILTDWEDNFDVLMKKDYGNFVAVKPNSWF